MPRVHGKGCNAARAHHMGCGVLRLDLDVLGIVVAPPHDDQVLDAPADVQAAVLDEALVPGAEEGHAMAVVVGEASAERLLGLLGPAPVADRNARRGYPKLAGCAVWHLAHRLRVDDFYHAEEVRPATYQIWARPRSNQLRWLDADRDPDDVLGKAVSRDGYRRKPARPEGRLELFDGVGAHALGGVPTRNQAGQVELGAVALGEVQVPARDQPVAEIRGEQDMRLIGRGGLQPLQRVG
mmetsp:Transcript_72897/g.202248  ORF Transcript_72897/g.202248 Transcript_72897/m.202248 type:complete len:239 (+) Transcript_72897:3056-3772(+)